MHSANCCLVGIASVKGNAIDVAVRDSGARVVVDVLGRTGAVSVVTRHQDDGV